LEKATKKNYKEEGKTWLPDNENDKASRRSRTRNRKIPDLGGRENES